MKLKLLSICATLCVLSITLARNAEAQQYDPEQAETFNAQGKELFKEKKYFEASKKFRRAIELNPSARYHFNLCFALNILERYRDALEQCEQVGQRGADEGLASKTDQLIVELHKRVPQDRVVPPNPVDPVNPIDTGGNPDSGSGTPPPL